MNILVVTDNFPPVVGGVALVGEMICHAVPAEHLYVIAPSWEGAADYDEKAPYAIRRVRSRSTRPPGVLRKLDTFVCTVILSWAVLLEVARRKWDIVIFTSVWPAGLLGIILRFIGKPYLIYAHGREIMQPRQWVFHLLRGYALRGSAKVLCNSNFCRGLVTDCGVSDERAVVCHPVIDLSRFESRTDIEEFKQKEAMSDRLIILSVGHVIARKGFDRVIRVLPRILEKFPQTLYIIAGKSDPIHGDVTAELRKLVDELALKDYVRIVGNRDIVKFFHACDINVMPSLYDLDKLYVETFGITFLEANACKKPVIGGNTGGMTDAVSDGESGLLVDVDDPDALADAIEKLLGDPDLRHTLGQQGFERVKREFTVASWTNRFSSILENL